MNRLALLLSSAMLAAALAAAPAMAQVTTGEHLTPQNNTLSGTSGYARYYARVIDAFPEAFDSDVKVRAIGAPAGAFLESATGIAANPDGSYRVFFAKTDIWLWNAPDPSTYVPPPTPTPSPAKGKGRHAKPAAAAAPPPPAGPKIGRCSRPIDAALANRIITVWSAMLEQTRYDVPEPGRAPVYFFSGGDPWLAGQASSWMENTRVHLLVRIVEEIGNYCQSGDATALKAQTDALSKRFGLP